MTIEGMLFESWRNRTMPHNDRLVNAFRAKFFLGMITTDLKTKCEKHHDVFNYRTSFISHDSRDIFLNLADSLILLILAHAKYYPDHPLCPWEHGTSALEHLFGVARTILDKFSYAEFLKHLKAVTIRLELLASGKYNAEKRARSGCGYVFG